MAVKPILLLGRKELIQKSRELSEDQLQKGREISQDLHDTILDFIETHGFGRAIAAPQIGEPYRIIHMYINDESTTMINPEISYPDNRMFEIWDDCMSFPGLEVKVMRYRRCILQYRDLNWQKQTQEFEGDLAELVQHEFDHLEGIVAVHRAIDSNAFRYNMNKFNLFKTT